jgi:uncharacterized protein YbjT (DUF2867 family)
MEQTGQTALVLGATGLIGGALIRQLLEHPQFDRVVALTRRPLALQHPRLEEEIIDFDRPDPAKIRGDVLFCAIGTTLKKAGSKEAQYRIDGIYPYEIGRIARENGLKKYLLVSSLGADAVASNFYLKTKGELEEKLRTLGFPSLVIVRPSILLGERTENRPGEKIGIVFARLLAPVLTGRLRKYRGIEAADVARALIALATANLPGVHVFESDRLTELAAGAPV